MIGIILFVILLILAVHSWVNFAAERTAGRLALAILFTVLLLPSILGTILKMTMLLFIGIAVLMVIGFIIEMSMGGKKSTG